MKTLKGKHNSFVSALMTLAVAAALLVLPGTARAGDVSFEITIPTIPYTPVIEKVTNKDAVVGNESFKVYAEISGQEQMEVCCDPSGNGGSGPDAVCSHECEPNCDFSECSMTDFYGIPDPRVSPNPTCIPNSVDTSGGTASDVCGGKSGNPKVFYYYNGDPTTGDSVDMVYDPDLSKFVADVPIGDYGDGDIVFFYISAVDNMGNVVSQVPDPETVPCTTLDAWSSEYSTPGIDNCSVMNVYTGVDSSSNCGVMVDGTPTCSGTYTQNDPVNDTCDSARKHDPSSPMVDIIGISAGAGKGYQGLEGQTVVCAKIGLGAPPPDPGASEGAMEAYVMVFFNPDIADPTPNDVHMTNAFALTYVPEVASAEPNLVRVLWDGDCVTDPNTADPLSCKIMSGGGSEERIKIGASGPNLTFISQNALPDGRTILGDKQNSTRAIIASGAINLSGDVPFWLTDTSAGLSIVKQSVQSTTIGPQPPVIPIPPSPGATACKWPDGSSFANSCDKSEAMPTKNTCQLTINKSPDADEGIVSEYRIYHSTVNDPNTASANDPVGTITSNLTGTNNFSYDVSELDGAPHYFFLSAVNQNDSSLETLPNDMSSTTCTPEDWEAPVAVSNLTCATPAGNEGKCQCSWTADSYTDPSLFGFHIWRDGDRLTVQPTAAVPDEPAYTYNFTDSDNILSGYTYSYSIKAIDRGENMSTEQTASCIAEDLKAPSKIDSLAITLTPPLNAEFTWLEGSDSDIEGYNVYFCEETVKDVSCKEASDFTKANSELVAGELSVEKTDLTEGNTYCFWVEACDDCASTDSCPSLEGESNCSSFDSMKPYRKCETIEIIPPVSPLYPEDLTVEAAPEGNTCNLEWNRVCNNEEGPFENCDYPTGSELSGYYIMRALAPTGNCNDVTVPENPVMNDPIGRSIVEANPSFTDTDLTNGTTYCYRAIAYNMVNAFSRNEPIPDPEPCTPMDTVPPDPPILKSPMSYTQESCSPEWVEVVDKDTLTYFVYRCDGDFDECSSSGDYSLQGTILDETPFYDDIVISEENYSYCITASDASNNTNEFFSQASGEAASGPGTAANCGKCYPSVRPKPPTDVNATEYVLSGDNYGVKTWWTDSESDDGTGVGYSVYLCSANTEDADSIDSNCTLAESALDGSRTIDSPYGKQNVGITTAGDYYVAVTYVILYNSNPISSQPEFSGTTINIPPPPGECYGDAPPASCISITVPTVKAITVAECEDCSSGYEIVDIAFAGVEVRVEDSSGTKVASTKTDSTGKVQPFKLDTASDLSLGSDYTIVALIPIADFNTAFKTKCRNYDRASDSITGDYCEYVLGTQTVAEAKDFTVPFQALPSTGGGGAEIGNANGDGAVNLFDIAEIKNAMGTTSTDTCYKPWADFNLDGNVNLFDLAVMKTYIGMEIDVSGDFDPALTSSKDPYSGDSECCKTGTCE